MKSLFSKLKLSNERLPTADLAVKSPVSGALQPQLDGEPFLQFGMLGELQQVQLSSNELLAPFSGRCVRRDETASLLSFIHPQGLRLDVMFPAAYQQHGQGFFWHVPADSQVQAGQAILTFDGTLLQQWQSPVRCLLQLHDHPKFQTIHGRTGFIAASDDLLYSIELKK